MIVRPDSWPDALAQRADRPDLRPINGGTDLMVEINFDRARPVGLLDLSHLAELASWELVDEGANVRLGAGVPYTRIIEELNEYCPALAIAARTVGSPQIRNRGTVGGNLATASPAGDAHPPLLACGAEIEVSSLNGSRRIAIDDFFLGPKKSALRPDELIHSIYLPVARGPQQFAKIGPRNAMVIATASFALSLDPVDGRVGTGIGSAGPTPLRAPAAEQHLAAALAAVAWSPTGAADPEVLDAFGRLVAEASQPIDDVRGSADYRRHGLAVVARRCADWAWTELAEGAER